MTQNNKLYAVLTGDLVNSSQLSSEKSAGAMARLKNAAMEFAHRFPATIVGQKALTRWGASASGLLQVTIHLFY
jgi:hypothetical protein